MAITLKEESILNEWSMMLGQAAGQGKKVLDEIEQRLEEADIPGECDWSLEQVQSSGFFAKVKREFLIVKLEQFKDYKIYIAARDYGVHLDCCRFLTVEPGFLKQIVSERLTGQADALSAPRNILVHQDLKAWVTVVHHAVLDAVEELMVELKQDPKLLNRGSKGLLDIW